MFEIKLSSSTPTPASAPTASSSASASAPTASSSASTSAPTTTSSPPVPIASSDSLFPATPSSLFGLSLFLLRSFLLFS